MRMSRGPGTAAPYQQIRASLRADILTNMAPGDQLPPERELAERFKVNRGTVSHAISKLVSEGLLVRVERRGTFVTDGDSGQPGARSGTVGLVVPYMQGAFPAGMIRSVIRTLRERDYRAILYDTEDSVEDEAAELERLMREGLDGALVMPTTHSTNMPTFQRLIRLGFPLVLIDRKPIGLECDCVASDNFRGNYELTSRLIARGHTRIAHFTWREGYVCNSVQERCRGYEQALKDHGIEVDPDLICSPVPFDDESLVYKSTLARLRDNERPVTAIVALADSFGIVAIAACFALGLRIPEDVEIAGFLDGLRPLGYDIPLLKAMQRQREIGRRAADLLVKRIMKRGPEKPQEILIPPDYVDWVSAPKQ